MARLGRTGRAAAAYVTLAGLQRGASLLILPFITHAMSPDEFGAASMMSAAALLLTAIIAAPLIQLVIRAAARGEENGPALLRTAGMYCYLLLPIAVAIVAIGIALLVPNILGVAGYIWAIELLAIGLQPAASTFALWVVQAREDLRRFTLLSTTSVLLTAVSKLLLVVVFDLGVLGWAISDLLSAALTALLAIILVPLPRARVSQANIRHVLSFSLPLVPHSASIWALSFLSRPAMAAVAPLEQVGLLSFGLNLALVAGLILAEVNRAALPRYSREVFPAPTGETFNPVRWQLVAALVVPAAVAAAVAIAGPWMFAPDYWPSFALTGILLAGQAAYGLYVIPMNYLTQTAGRPRFSSLASGAGASLVFVFILGFGNRYGATGVAYATAAGYLVMAIVAMVLVKALKLEIAWSMWLREWPGVVVGVAALACGALALGSRMGSVVGWLCAGACLLLVTAAVALTARRQHSERVHGSHGIRS